MTRRSLLLLLLCIPSNAIAQQVPKATPPSIDVLAAVPPLRNLVARPTSDLAPVVERYTADQQSLARRYDANDSPAQRRRMRGFAVSWRTRLREVDFERLNPEGRSFGVAPHSVSKAAATGL